MTPDLAAVFARLGRDEPTSYGATKQEMQEAFSNIMLRLADHVPASIDLRFHFCYGDAGHKVRYRTDRYGGHSRVCEPPRRENSAAHPTHPHAGAA